MVKVQITSRLNQHSYLGFVVEGNLAASLVGSTSNNSVPCPGVMGTSQHLSGGNIRGLFGVLQLFLAHLRKWDRVVRITLTEELSKMLRGDFFGQISVVGVPSAFEWI